MNLNLFSNMQGSADPTSQRKHLFHARRVARLQQLPDVGLSKERTSVSL